jgi:DDE domain
LCRSLFNSAIGEDRRRVEIPPAVHDTWTADLDDCRITTRRDDHTRSCGGRYTFLAVAADHGDAPVGGSWRVDETYLKVSGQWMYLYRAVDKRGKTVESYLESNA